MTQAASRTQKPKSGKVVWTHGGESLLSRPRLSRSTGSTQNPLSCGEPAVSEKYRPQNPVSPHGQKQGFHQHRSYLFLTTAALAILALLSLAGCQTPPQTAAPAFGTTVPPPATGMLGQPAPYGSFAGAPPGAPQGVAYPPAANAPPMPGPATAWQGATAPTAPAANSWTWPQASGAPTVPPSLPPNGAPMVNQNPQLQQPANQWQGLPPAQQYANQVQPPLANAQQPAAGQLQNTANPYQQAPHNPVQQYPGQAQQNLQAQQQQLTNQFQQNTQQAATQMQAVPQYQQYPAAQQQTANGNWWPFSNTSAMPPARTTPMPAPRY